MKLWKGRITKELDNAANDFNSSVSVDGRMYREDIEGSLAHVAMLGATGILGADEAAAIGEGLTAILADLDSGKISVDTSSEDIHSFVENELTLRLGDLGKKLHTGRSRNDQVALDTRLYLVKTIDKTTDSVKKLLEAILGQARSTSDVLVPSYTHLQRAQPVFFAQHLLAYAEMLKRDCDRLSDCRKRTNVSPLGCAALAGTSYPIDRAATAATLGMDGFCANSIDGVSDRDFVLEFAADLAILQMHLSRFAEETILWCSSEFRYVELDDSFSTGSSIMPQKKNPDIAELVRGKTGRVYGNLVALLTVMKGLPLAYNKDMQEDKELIFDSADTVNACLTVFAPMLATAKINRENMRNACAQGFINATDVADYLVIKGLPFRDAYKLTGGLVATAVSLGATLEELPIATYRAASELFGEDIYAAIDMKVCAEKRTSAGGTSTKSIKNQIDALADYLKN